MKTRLSRTTAVPVAVFRAVGTMVREHGWRGPDNLAERLVPWSFHPSALIKVPGVRRLVSRLVERIAPGGMWYEVVRCRYMDDVVRTEIARGARQLVVLGAGLDSRAHRMVDALAGATVYEVDHPVMSAHKQVRVLAAFGADALNQAVHVPADLERQDLGEVLTAAGHDPETRSVVVWAGVTPYLEPAAVARTLRWMAAQKAAAAWFSTTTCRRSSTVCPVTRSPRGSVRWRSPGVSRGGSGSSSRR
ncbi:hypothetical protein GCM10029964_039010 [Kibdelosporangium lantanae]